MYLNDALTFFRIFFFFYIFYQYAAKSRQIVRMNCMLFDNLFF